MPTSITLSLDGRRPVGDWTALCDAYGLRYNPCTVGQGTWRLPQPPGRRGGVEATLDGEGSIGTGPDGRVDPGTAVPPATFGEVTLGIVFGEPTDALGALARELCARLPFSVSPSDEAAHEVSGLPRSFVAGSHYEADEIMPTDFPSGWARDGRGLSARVPAGDARISPDGGLLGVEVDGVRVASFRDEAGAMAFAGRFGWDWWAGQVPPPLAPAAPAIR